MPVSVGHIIEALSSFGGEAHLDDIVRRVSEIAPKPLPADVGASVRARIQERCAETSSYKGGDNLFYSKYGVAARKGWWGLLSDDLNPANPDGFQDGAEPFIESQEGRASLRIHLRKERSQKLIKEFKSGLLDYKCQVCDFDFETIYGELGKGYIEAHHIIPVSSLEEGSKTKVKDLAAVCANCHRMIHRSGCNYPGGPDVCLRQPG